MVASGDSDAWLARVDGTGGSLETRRFDIRGALFPAPQPVSSDGFDLTVAPGDPDTLVVGGQATTDRGTEWALAAFNDLDGPLSALQSAELVVPIASAGGAHGVAGAPGGIVFGAGGVEDTSSHDESIAMGRALVDAEKRCDLSLSVPSPVELIMRGTVAGAMTVKVANVGQRPCSGVLSVPAPWELAGGTLAIGRLIPGTSVTEVLSLAYGAAFPQNATLNLSLVSPTDAALGDNSVALPVVFSFCDLELSAAGFAAGARYRGRADVLVLAAQRGHAAVQGGAGARGCAGTAGGAAEAVLGRPGQERRGSGGCRRPARREVGDAAGVELPRDRPQRRGCVPTTWSPPRRWS